MKFLGANFSGSIEISGSLHIPYGNKNQRPSNPESGSLFLEISDSGSNVIIYNGQSGSGWEYAGVQGNALRRTFAPIQADIEYLVVAGGGGGGGGGWGAGGGGAGGMLSSSLSSIESGSSITVTVGAGGTGRGGGNTFTAGGDGGDSSIATAAGTAFTTVTSTGGGGGGAESDNSGLGHDGGSGGGSTVNNASGGSGTAGQGNDGGAGTGYSSPGYPGGGGGGKGSVGSTPSGNNGGDGGTGEQSSITGTATYYAGGGGGGTRTSGAQGTGGSSVGGDGANDATAATAATANRGGGGGGAAGNAAADGSNGGSGVLILAYDSGSINGVGGIVGDAGSGRKYHQFNSSGTFKAGSTSDFGIVTDSLSLYVDAGNFDSRGTTTWTDLSGNGRNGTTVGSPPLGQNFYYELNGSDWITFSSDALITDTSYTIQGWIKVTSQSGWDGKFPFYNTYNNSVDGGVWHHFYTNKIAWRHYGASTSYADITGFSLSTNTWTFVSIIYNSSDSTIKVYKDTSLVGSSSSVTGFYAGSDNSNVGGTIGKLNNRSSGTIYDVSNVQIANQLIYTKALTTDEITQNYNATKTNFV